MAECAAFTGWAKHTNGGRPCAKPAITSRCGMPLCGNHASLFDEMNTSPERLVAAIQRLTHGNPRRNQHESL